MFNNFRAPNSALSILPIFLVFGSFTGIQQWYSQLQSDKKKNRKLSKTFWIYTGSVMGLCLIFAIAGSALMSFEGPNAQKYAQQGVLDVIIDDIIILLCIVTCRSIFILL